MPATARRRDAGSTDLVAVYLDEIGAYPMLTRSEEVELARRGRAGDRDALQRLVCANLRFVVSIAKRYHARGLPLIDLINEGNIGLMQAAERFDETKGVRFISYAVWWVRQAIFQALAEHGHAVRVPVGRASSLLRLRRRAEQLRQELGREPTREELAATTDMSDEELTHTLPLTRPYVSLDAGVGENDDVSLLDCLAADDVADQERDVNEVALGAALAEALERLRERDALVVRMYFGLDGAEPKTLEAIGAELGITRERARQLKERALRTLRRSVDGEVLAALHQ